MSFRILVTLLICLAFAGPAAGETVRISKADCSRLVEHRAAPDVAFKPGVDVRGRKVAPAGGPDSKAYGKLVPGVIEFSIALNPLKGGAARFGETTLSVGTIQFDMKSQRATLKLRKPTWHKPRKNVPVVTTTARVL